MSSFNTEQIVEKFGSVRAFSKMVGIAESTLRDRLKRNGVVEFLDDYIKDDFKTKEVNKNELEINSVSPRIKTLEQAIAHGEIDLET